MITYQPSTTADGWRSTANLIASPVLPQWPGVKPFALNTQNWQKSAISAVSTARPAPPQTEIALFWADGGGSFTPPGHWNQIAQGIATEKHNTLQENARLFALVNIAVADAGIAAWDAKYTYNQFRPIHAIRSGANDGSTVPWSLDPSWTPLLGTPNFPDYISGHSSTFSGAGSTVLAALYGDQVGFSTTSPLAELAGITRSFDSFSQAADEAGRSRIYGGIHWESSNQDGLSVGRQVGAPPPFSVIHMPSSSFLPARCTPKARCTALLITLPVSLSAPGHPKTQLDRPDLTSDAATLYGPFPPHW